MGRFIYLGVKDLTSEARRGAPCNAGRRGCIPPLSDKSTVFQLQDLRKYPRRPCGSFWYHLELREPKFDRFRHFFIFCFCFFDPEERENSTCSCIF